jgi:hypothetical protein
MISDVAAAPYAQAYLIDEEVTYDDIVYAVVLRCPCWLRSRSILTDIYL